MFLKIWDVAATAPSLMRGSSSASASSGVWASATSPGDRDARRGTLARRPGRDVDAPRPLSARVGRATDARVPVSIPIVPIVPSEVPSEPRCRGTSAFLPTLATHGDIPRCLCSLSGPFSARGSSPRAFRLAREDPSESSKRAARAVGSRGVRSLTGCTPRMVHATGTILTIYASLYPRHTALNSSL